MLVAALAGCHREPSSAPAQPLAAPSGMLCVVESMNGQTIRIARELPGGVEGVLAGSIRLSGIDPRVPRPKTEVVLRDAVHRGQTLTRVARTEELPTGALRESGRVRQYAYRAKFAFPRSSTQYDVFIRVDGRYECATQERLQIL